MTPDAEAAYRAGLLAGHAVLAQGGAALEDDPLFNAGHGAVFTSDGRHEMDAAALAGWAADPLGPDNKADADARLVFRLALRQAEAFAASVLRLLGLTLAVPDHATLSRRGRAFAGRQPRGAAGGGPMHLVLDSTGLQLFGQGAWDAGKYGWTRRRSLLRS